jgi:hypothetical protein
VKKSRLKEKPRFVSLSLLLSMELIVMNIVLTSGFINGKTEKSCRKVVKYSSSIYRPRVEKEEAHSPDDVQRL